MISRTSVVEPNCEVAIADLLLELRPHLLDSGAHFGVRFVTNEDFFIIFYFYDNSILSFSFVVAMSSDWFRDHSVQLGSSFLWYIFDETELNMGLVTSRLHLCRSHQECMTKTNSLIGVHRFWRNCQEYVSRMLHTRQKHVLTLSHVPSYSQRI